MGCLKALITCALIASLAQAISMGGDALEDRQESWPKFTFLSLVEAQSLLVMASWARWLHGSFEHTKAPPRRQ